MNTKNRRRYGIASLVFASCALAAMAAVAGWLWAQQPAPAAATQPGYYRVAGTAPAAMYAQPGGMGPALGSLPTGTGPLEVVAVERVDSEPWGLIATGEGAAWIAMRSLETIEPPGVLASILPMDARCSGTEPFWGLSFDAQGARFLEPLAATPAETRLPLASVEAAAGRSSPLLLSFADEGGYAVAERELCSDGMSDIPYGWTLHLILTGEAPDEKPRLLSGCCRVPMPSP